MAKISTILENSVGGCRVLTGFSHFQGGFIMRYLLGIFVVLWGSVVSAQDIFWADSYSSPDYGYGYRTETWGYSGRLGSPLTPYYSESYTSPSYGYGGRYTSTYGYSYGSSYSSWPYRSPSGFSVPRRRW